GQGTANRRVFFHNAMLEFLWVRAVAETLTPTIAPLQLAARANHRQTGFSPFGMGLRYAPNAPAIAALPFATWAYRPPYWPPHLQFEVAHTHPHEPLIFVMPFRETRPDTLPPAKRQPLDHPSGRREITAVRLTVPAAGEPRSPALQALAALGIVTFATGADHCAELTFDHHRRGQRTDFRPGLSLIFLD
ncbi:MAG TPA: hypothetical protein V6D02_05230, partial [Candidatus Obscuribacterales bacterium]